MNSNFEKEISNKLYNSESTPPDGMFENIMAKRANNSKTPLFTGAIKSILVGVVLLGSVLIYFQVNPNENKVQDIASNEISNNKKSVDIVEEAKPENITKTNNIQTSKNNTSELIEQKVSTSSEIQRAKLSKTVAISEKSNEKSQLNVEKSKSSILDLNNKKSLTEKYHNIVKSNQINSITSENVYQSYFDANSNIKPVISSEQHKGKSHLYQYESVDESIIDKSDINFFFTNKLNKLNVKSSTEEIAEVKTKKIEVPRKLKNPILIDFTAMPMFTIHHAFGNSSLLNDYHQIEKTTLNNLFEIRVNMPLKNNLSVYSGMAYTQMNHLYSGQIFKTKHVIEYVNRTIFINDPITGVRPVTVTDRLEYDKETKTNFNFKNKYQVFQLPIGVSYNYGYKKFDFAINTGINLNLINSIAGYNLNQNSDGLVSYSSSKKNINLGANFGVMATYPLNYKYKLVFEPHLNMFGINANKFGNNINPNTLNLGVKLGLRYTVF